MYDEAAQDKRSVKYYQLRVKSTAFLEKPAIAIYFYNVTHHIESIKQKTSFQVLNNKHDSLFDSYIVLQLDFRTNLTCSLMFLDGLLRQRLP